VTAATSQSRTEISSVLPTINLDSATGRFNLMRARAGFTEFFGRVSRFDFSKPASVSFSEKFVVYRLSSYNWQN
jgi:hypothetical protein